MQQNPINPYQNYQLPQQGPNAVNINIIAPQAYGGTNGAAANAMPAYTYPLWGQNANPALPYYPQNYNNLNNYIGQPNPNNNQGQGLNNSRQALNETNLLSKTNVPIETTNTDESKKKTKKVTPLTNEYIMSLENYMNNENPKIRLLGTKELLERFKESETRKDNPSLIPLLNKALKDPSASVRFLALTTLQLGYSVGNDETVTILKEIQTKNQDKLGEDALLASEILLKLAGGQKSEILMTENEIQQELEKNKKSNKGEQK